jgi:type II secretory pathway pseudopilin PulG
MRALDARGFSVIEVLFVLLITTTVLALTVTGMQEGLAKTRVNTTAHKVAGYLRLAREMAVARGGEWECVRVHFPGRFEVRPVLRESGEEGQPVFVSDPFAPGVTVRPLGAWQPIRFHASASPAVGSNQRIEIRSGSAVKYVIISPVYGRIRVGDGPPARESSPQWRGGCT